MAPSKMKSSRSRLKVQYMNCFRLIPTMKENAHSETHAKVSPSLIFYFCITQFEEKLKFPFWGIDVRQQGAAADQRKCD